MAESREYPARSRARRAADRPLDPSRSPVVREFGRARATALLAILAVIGALAGVLAPFAKASSGSISTVSGGNIGPSTVGRPATKVGILQFTVSNTGPSA